MGTPRIRSRGERHRLHALRLHCESAEEAGLPIPAGRTPATPDASTATGRCFASHKSVNSLVSGYGLLPFRKHDAAINSQATELTFAIGAIEVDVKELLAEQGFEQRVHAPVTRLAAPTVSGSR